MRRFVAVFVLLLFFFCRTATAFASCTATLSPESVLINSQQTFDLTIQNTGSNPLTYIRIPTNLNGDITVLSASGSGWELMLEGGADVLFGGSIAANTSQSFTIASTIGPTEKSLSWGLQASEQSDGSNAFDCAGGTVTIVSSLPATPAPEATPPPVAAPEVSNISVAAGSTSATVTWRLSSEATGIVYYGKTTEYGNGVSTQAGEPEKVVLTDLSPSTTYHYQIQVTGVGGTTIVSDNTFTTSALGEARIITTTVTSVVSTTTTNTVTVTNTQLQTQNKFIEVKDLVPPKIAVTTKLKKTYTQAPEIGGTASDRSGISQVSYSLDGGQNWLPVTQIQKQYAQTTSFRFSPEALLDGDYKVKIRVVDGAGNVGFSSIETLVIDRLPPQAGLASLHLGPISIDSTIIEGMTATLTVSAIGGPTDIQVLGQHLQKNQETGLWTSDITFGEAGEYPLDVIAVDGAENRTTNSLGTLHVIPAGSLGCKGSVTVYVFDATTERFQVWDAAPFTQKNPQTTGESGAYRFILPPGRYYLEASAKGKRTARTTIFSLAETSPITMNFQLRPASWWWFLPQIDEVAWVSNPLVHVVAIQSENKTLPFFALPTTTESQFYSSTVRGIPTVMTFLSTWIPVASEQVSQLEKVAQNKNYRAVGVFVQQPVSLATIFTRRGGYSLTTIVDRDGQLLRPLGITTVPTHVFLDRKGTITRVVPGLLSADDVLQILSAQ